NHTGYHTPKYQEYPYKRFESRHFNRSQNNEVEQWLYGLPDLDHDQPEVADYFVQNILDWIEATGIDAIRMDTVKHVEDTFWYFFKSQIKTRYPQVTLLGEVLDPNPSVIGRYQQEHDFDTLFDFPLREAIMQTLVYDHPLTKLARPRLNDHEPQGVLDQNKPYTNANRLVTLLDNHDLGQRFTTDILDRVGHQDRELACKILKLCLTFLFTTRGIPQIYYGTEIGMEGRKDPDNRRDMVWSVFGSDQRPTADHWFEREIFDHLRSLIQFRSQNPAIRYGCLLTLFVDQFVYVYLREFRGNVVLVAINNGQGDMPVPLPIQIKDNRHLPPRVNGLLTEGRRFRAFFSHLPNLIVQTNQVAIQLPGKTAGV
ncbi:MAG TPA: alpha-amylase family glycosyl hydrolase, partial [Acidobacteriota bacterium]|nr:alpha-amylase family glycosyl hydrolase [Acidobacteriota bacterium]